MSDALLTLNVKQPKEKKSKKKKKKKNKKKKETIEAVNAYLEIEKRYERLRAEFKRDKTSFHIALKNNNATEEMLVSLRTIRNDIIKLFDEWLSSVKDGQMALVREIDELTQQYDAVKRKKTDNLNLLTEARAQSEKIKAALTDFEQRQAQQVLKNKNIEGAGKLSSKDREHIKEMLDFYQLTEKLANANSESRRALRENDDTQKERKAELKSKKGVLISSQKQLKDKNFRIRRLLADFSHRNQYLTKTLVEIQQEKGADVPLTEIIEEELNVITLPLIQEGEQEEEEAEDLSETVESQSFSRQLEEVREALAKGEYQTLKERFNQEWQAFFLDRLIVVYNRKLDREIALEGTQLIGYLLEKLGAYIPFVYQLLISTKYDVNEKRRALVAYLDANPDLRIDEPLNRIESILMRAPSLNRLELLKEVDRFVNNEVPPSQQQEEEEEEVIRVIEIEPTLFIVEVEEEEQTVSEELKRRENTKARVLFGEYEIRSNKGLPLFNEGLCTYEVYQGDEAFMVYITNSTSGERQTYELLSNFEGFVSVKEFFQLQHFPESLFERCRGVRRRYAPVDIFILERLPFSLEEVFPYFSADDEFCLLYDLLSTLRHAKTELGFQHNALTRTNIRFKLIDNPSQQLCKSRYRVTLVDFSHATLDTTMSEETRGKLTGNDYNAILILLKETAWTMCRQKIEPLLELFEETNEVDGIAFDTLLLLLTD
jgi:hypothetical protein